MRLLFGLLFVGMLACPVHAERSSPVALTYKSYRNWPINLPAEKWQPVKDGIRPLGETGHTYKCVLQGTRLGFDTTGDGKIDRTIKAKVDAVTAVESARVILTAGNRRVAVRLRRDGGEWEWSVGGVMSGMLQVGDAAIPVRIVDQNGNGSFNDVGEDAMVLGTRDQATFLSRVINVGQKLYSVSVSRDGSTLTTSAWDGPVSSLDMSTSFDSKAVLLSAVVRSEDGKNSFDFGAMDGPVKIPAGTYQFVSGTLGLGQQRVKIHGANMKPIQLKADQQESFAWGGPVKTQFEMSRRGDKITFSPDAIWFYGAAGEQYTGWAPRGKSPEFTIRNRKSGEVLEVAILPGSC